jgi:hypothetical protein
LWWEPALALGDYNPAVFTGYEPELAPEAITVAQEQAQGRIKGLAYPLWFQSGLDPDPTNNQATMFFQTAPPLLPPGVLAILTQVMGGSTPLEFIWEVLTGQSDNWWAIGGNIVLSFAPVAGTVLDLISLFTDPTLWGKAMSLIGLVASIISDGAEILTAVGVAVPPALAALPAAVGAEAIDVGAAILKNVRRLVSTDVFDIIKNIPFDEALQLGADALGHLAKRAVASVSTWPSGDPIAIFGIIQNVLSSVWDPFVALLKRFDGRLDELFTLGFGDGSFLAGRVLKQGVELSDEVIETLVKIGDDLGKAGVELSDNAVGGLGKLANSLPEGHLQGIVKNLCPGGVTEIVNYRIRGLASPLRQEVCSINFQKILENVIQWDEVALDGFKKLGGTVDEATLTNFLTKYANDAVTSNRILTIVGNSTGSWNKIAFDGLDNVVSKANIQIAERLAQNYPNVAEKAFQVLSKMSTNWSDDAVEGVARLVDITIDQNTSRVFRVIEATGGAGTGENMFRRIKLAGDRLGPNQVGNGWQTFARKLSGSTGDIWGSYHTLDYMETLGFNQIQALERQVTRQVEGIGSVTRQYDIVDVRGNFYELKNVQQMTTDSFNELTRDLQLLSDAELRNLRWVFRGSGNAEQNASIVSQVLRRVRQIDPSIIEEGLFTQNNIIFHGNSRPF